MSTGESSIGGLRPAVPADCREFLRSLDEALGDAKHPEHCAQCAGHAAFRARFATLLKTRPTPPARLLSREIVEAIQERIVEGIEATSSIGEMIAAGLPLTERDWSAALPDPVSAGNASPLDPAIIRALGTSPILPSVSAWTAVQKSVIATVGSKRATKTRTGLWLGAAGLAAAAILGVSLPWSGTTEGPAIVFAELESMPSIEFSMIRYGALR